MFWIIILNIAALALLDAAPAPPSQYDHHINIVADLYDLYWSIQGDTATFEVHVKTLGYVGFGISRTGGMKGADIVMGWVKDGQVVFQDRYADGHAMPAIDYMQNWNILEGREEGDYTILIFSRPLISCDKEQDMDITDQTVRLIYSFNGEDPLDADNVLYHGGNQRGTKSVTLIPYNTSDPSQFPSDAVYYDILNPGVDIPAKDTTYWCQAFKLPELSKKHHVIKYEPIVQEGHEGLVHHILAYACYHKFNETAYEGRGAECYKNLMGEVDRCDAVIFGWAIGGGSINYPPHTGFPIGGGQRPTMIPLETHYNNPPPSTSGIKDSSGFRIWYTPTLRQYDSGMLEAGTVVNPWFAIPPHYESFVSVGHCSTECFSKAIPENEDIKVYAVLMHEHLLGTSVTVRHFRNGYELPPIVKDEYYDFNYQEFRTLQTEVSILPNDHIIVECNYTSVKRVNVTYGGLSTREEMCLVYMPHYPKRVFCLTVPTPKQSVEFINPTLQEKQVGSIYTDFKVVTPSEYANLDYIGVMEKTDWQNKSIREKFQDVITKPGGTAFQFCNDGYNIPLIKSDMIYIIPQMKEFYVAPIKKCARNCARFHKLSMTLLPFLLFFYYLSY